MVPAATTDPDAAWLFIQHLGLRDSLIPHVWAARGLERIGRAYAAAGASEHLIVDRFDCEHEFHGAVALDALRRWKERTL